MFLKYFYNLYNIFKLFTFMHFDDDSQSLPTYYLFLITPLDLEYLSSGAKIIIALF